MKILFEDKTLYLLYEEGFIGRKYKQFGFY